MCATTHSYLYHDSMKSNVSKSVRQRNIANSMKSNVSNSMNANVSKLETVAFVEFKTFEFIQFETFEFIQFETFDIIDAGGRMYFTRGNFKPTSASSILQALSCRFCRLQLSNPSKFVISKKMEIMDRFTCTQCLGAFSR